MYGLDQERLGDRRRLRRGDMPEVSSRLELQFRNGLRDERLLPELLLRAEELCDAGPLVWLGDGHLRKPAVLWDLQQLARVSDG